MDLKNIRDNTIIICENAYKNYILKYFSEQNIFLNVKFYSKKEFIQKYLFTYNEKEMYYLRHTYNLKPSIAKMYLDNLYFIQDKEYKSNKLNYLVKLMHELKDQDYLPNNNNFSLYLKDKEIIVYNYPYLSNKELEIFNHLQAKIISDNGSFTHKKVYKFKNIDDEINYVAKTISELLKKGININNIKLSNVSKDYYNKLRRIFKYYKIPIKIPSNNNLYCNEIGINFLKNMPLGLDTALETIENNKEDIVNQIISIVNKYYFVENKKDLIDLITYDFKNTKIDNYNYDNYIEIIDFESVNSSDYIFLMNFSSGSIPKLEKDENYITDNIKYELEEKTTVEINQNIREFTKNKINSIEHLFMSYSENYLLKENYPSPLIKEMNLEIEDYKDNIYLSYSTSLDKLKYASLLDNYYKYGDVNELYFAYKYNLNDIGYLSYKNNFSGITKSDLIKYLDSNLVLSYSSLTNYNKCAFKYYLNHILKLNKYEETFETFIGSMYHKVLEKCLDNKNNIESVVKEYIKNSNIEITPKERFFIKKFIKYIEFVKNSINEQKQYISLDKSLNEQNIEVKLKDNVKLVGYVDKILYKELPHMKVVSVIDYKTGYTDIDLRYTLYGMNLQLPIYLYLISKSNLFSNPSFAGFYIQNILDMDILRNQDKSYEEMKKENLKLEGYSNNDQDIIKYLDNEFERSNLIKGLRVKNDGTFYSSSKTLSSSEINNLYTLTEKIINKNVEDILNGNFDINPKKVGYDKIDGCTFCKFKDICFKKEKDYVNLKDIEDLSFLKGDKND